jgi:hypothetical protein
MAESVGRCGPGAVIGDLEFEFVLAIGESHGGMVGVCVFERVRESLLDYPVSREIDCTREWEWIAVGLQLDW